MIREKGKFGQVRGYVESDYQRRAHAKSEIHQVWDALQCLQVDFCINQELASYYTNPAWHRAEKVLDVGTGNGYYLQRLAALFPGKRYLGTDLEPEYIELAKARNDHANIEFTIGNLFELDGQYDFIIVRLVMQHLHDGGAAIARLAKLLKPGGNVLIIDALDKSRFFHPVPEEFVRFFDTYKSTQLKAGMDRDVASKIGDLVKSHAALRQAFAHELIVPSTIPGNLDLFDKTYYLVIVMLELAGTMDCDFDSAKQSWRNWCKLEDRYMQVGLRLVNVHRIAG